MFLTPYAPEHAAQLNVMSSDPEVMRYLGDVETMAETEAYIAKAQMRWQKYGFGWWSVFLRDSDTLVGAACLQHLAHEESAPLEIGWRLVPAFHGKGFATEAGRAAMEYGFQQVGVDYLVSVAHRDNLASQKVMERLGMTYRGLETHYGESCAVYEITRPGL
nr:GNAT family N-acetyltransferase [Litoreibacter ponti]